jgi:YidC/Oxa1 family membrane protein insertase
MDRKLLFAVVASIATLWIFHYYRGDQTAQQSGAVPADVRPGVSYRVPTSQDLAKPIFTEIDFVDKKVTQKEEIKDIETDLCTVSFSNHGGIVSSVDFKKHLGKNGTPLRTIHRKSFYEREQGSFLLALDEKTPYFYNLVDYKNGEDQKTIVYQTQVDGWLIKKSYTLYKDSYKIDLSLNFEQKSKETKAVSPRLFFAAPFVGEVQDEAINGFSVGLDGKSINKISENELNQAWVMPSLFGAEDKYFAHALVADSENFVQRSFFKKEANNLFSILEGPEIKESSSWKFSFYVGPKLLDDMVQVDERLEGVLSFGWLSWLCKLLLKLLDWLFSFFKNFGVAIIVLTILLKLPFLPLTITGRRKMEEYQKHQPSLNRIRMKYKHDIKRQQEEMARYHKDHNISPTAMLQGCFPMLIQMPILFALYRVLNGYLDLYQAPFFGWIIDLSSKDPYYVLPILMGASMLLQQSMTPVMDSKQKVMQFFMPLIFTAIFINFPAGLVLYWLTNNVLMLGEDYLRKVVFK